MRMTQHRQGVDLLAMPAYGPWAAMKETIDFVRAVGALEGFPIHGELLNERGHNLVIPVTDRRNDQYSADRSERGWRYSRVLTGRVSVI